MSFMPEPPPPASVTLPTDGSRLWINSVEQVSGAESFTIHRDPCWGAKWCELHIRLIGDPPPESECSWLVWWDRESDFGGLSGVGNLRIQSWGTGTATGSWVEAVITSETWEVLP